MEFKEWVKDYRGNFGPLKIWGDQDMQAAYEAGVQAERDRCARVAEEEAKTLELHRMADHATGARGVAAAIRRQG